MVQTVNTTMWNHPPIHPTSSGQLCFDCDLSTSVPLLFWVFFGCNCYRRRTTLIELSNVCCHGCGWCWHFYNAHQCSLEVFSQAGCWNKAISRLSFEDCLWYFSDNFSLMDSLLKSYWRDVTARRRSTKPSLGSNRDLSDTSLGRGEMILIVALPQPSS